jgi:hypothetical protein
MLNTPRLVYHSNIQSLVFSTHYVGAIILGHDDARQTNPSLQIFQNQHSIILS